MTGVVHHGHQVYGSYWKMLNQCQWPRDSQFISGVCVGGGVYVVVCLSVCLSACVWCLFNISAEFTTEAINLD